MQNPRVAIIGAGHWGRNIIRTLAMSPSTIAYIAHSGSAETKAFLADTYHTIPTTTDYHETLRDDSIGAVIIATPIETHYAIVRDALNAGKHVLCEKPLALTGAEVAELYELAHAQNCILMTGYLYRYDAGFNTLVEKVRSVTRVDLDFMWEKYGSFDSPLSENLLVHELSLMLSIFETIRLDTITRNEADVFDATFKGDRGTAHIHIDRTKEDHTKKITATTDGETFSHHFTQNDLLDIELTAFLSEVQSGTFDNKKRQRIDESIAAILEELRH